MSIFFLCHVKRTYILYSILFAMLPLKNADADDCELWLIDTHPASSSRPTEQEFRNLTYNRLGMHGWDRSDLETFTSTHDPENPLLIVIHGNLMTYVEASYAAQRFYSLLGEGKYRLAFWCWPAEKTVKGLRNDVLLKARRSDRQAEYLLMFLRQLPAGSKVSLAGFSFGARITCMALERLTETDLPVSLRLRAALLAPAIDEYWLAPGRRFGRSLEAVEKMLIYYNPRDCVLKFYPMMYGLCGRNRPEALGRTGPPVWQFPAAYRDRLEIGRTTRSVGKEHSSASSLRTFRYDGRFEAIALFAE